MEPLAMPHIHRSLLFAAVLLAGSLVGLFASAEEFDAAGVEFFEKEIRPVLVEQCYQCHSQAAKNPKGGLRLDSRAGLLRGGDSGPAIEPGKPEASLLVDAIRYGDSAAPMPPERKLPPQVVKAFEQWIRLGAPDPREETKPQAKSEIDIDEGRKFWAFQPPRATPPPQFDEAAWPRSDIDALIYARLQQTSISPVEDASRTTLIRRVYFDLIGLPPTPQAIDAFVADESEDAFENLVDDLLARGQFGERWGRHWLDVAKYAESTGRSVNFPFNHAWRYRNYVIDAFNNDKPYDQFLREQIAGDLLPAESPEQSNEQRIATGFLVVGPRELNCDDREAMETERYFLTGVDEQIDVVCRGVLGLTASCARCHDHKFDPIPTAEYYAMAGIFRSTTAQVGFVHGLGNSARFYPEQLIALDGAAKPLVEQRAKYVQQASDAWAAHKKEMTELWLVRKREGQAGFTNAMREKQEKIVKNNKAVLDKLAKKLPAGLPFAMGVVDGSDPADIHVCIAGDPERVGPLAPRGFLQVLSTPGTPPLNTQGSGRLELAQWLASAENPLTARVMVNRIWSHLFGRGLVATVDNFGANGETPSHPALLDNLAVDFAQDWSIKNLIRRIVLSRTYQLASVSDSANHQVDPENRLLWRMNRRRLEVEPLRDAILSVSGNLNLERPNSSPLYKYGASQIGNVGGMPNEVKVARGGYRSVYQTIVRDLVPKMFRLFDFPPTSSVKGRRDVTTVATQALFMMNDPIIVKQSELAAARVLKDESESIDARITLAYRRTLGRHPLPQELQTVREFLETTPAEPAKDAQTKQPQPSVWAQFLQMLFASAEFRYLE